LDNYGVLNKFTSVTEHTYEDVREKALGPPYNNSTVYIQYIITPNTDPRAYSWDGANVNYNASWSNPDLPTQKILDYRRYKLRAENKDHIIAEMASNNMERVRSGEWSVPDLIGLTQDPQLKEVLDDVSTLSFELAIQKLSSVTHPLMTAAIKTEWIDLLTLHLYL